MTEYKIRFYNPWKKKWEDWKNFGRIHIFNKKQSAKDSFESTLSFRQYKLKYKIIEFKK